MAKSIGDVSGIGPATAALLKEAGIGTVEKLAAASLDRVSAIKGFGEIRAARVIEAAKSLLAADGKTVAADKKPKKKKAAKPSSEKAKKASRKKKDKKGDKKKSDKKKPAKKKKEKKGQKKK
jgi:hypothetical protein